MSLWSATRSRPTRCPSSCTEARRGRAAAGAGARRPLDAAARQRAGGRAGAREAQRLGAGASTSAARSTSPRAAMRRPRGCASAGAARSWSPGAGSPALACSRGEAWSSARRRFEDGSREGCGDTMMGAHGRGAGGRAWIREVLVLGAAAGAANFLHHGLGTGSRPRGRGAHGARRPASLASVARGSNGGSDRLAAQDRAGAVRGDPVKVRAAAARSARGARAPPTCAPAGPSRDECASLPSTCRTPVPREVVHALRDASLRQQYAAVDLRQRAQLAQRRERGA